MFETARARAAGGIAARVPPAQDTIDFDPLVVCALRAVLVSRQARRLAWHLGPDLFEHPAARMLAGCFITERELPPSPGGRYARELHRLLDEVANGGIPPAGEPEWAVHLVRQLAAVRYRPMLAETLAWARTAVLEGQPLAFILRRVVWAFAAAMGTRPLDAAMNPGGRREWA